MSPGGDIFQAGVIVMVGITAWVAAHFVINRITERIKRGTSIFKKPHFRWAQPILRNQEQSRRIQRADTVGSLLKSIVSIFISGMVIIMVMDTFKLPIAPLLTSVGIAGVAIGFGAQQLVRDFLSGIFITIEDQYGIGDTIVTSEVVGRVDAVGLRVTRVIDDEGVVWYLRNGEILRVGNRSQGNYQPKADVEHGSMALAEQAAE
ncbi:mechanosensitive ion channel family protein [Arthrobacter sp. I2-34]|uniref:Mechanosensitive ion channel family protein n=1 Tax=Arthrobacter hankyongi TaxID=2904801 RepID=A0ABS9LDB8_9MICC|nr:mechanosensitive ion channel domain-containing protein [Arthrobacter hankyongi]MCG2624670.1 mechanosensitive ion channel family protein [Arthrobacter hankyongi]